MSMTERIERRNALVKQAREILDAPEFAEGLTAEGEERYDAIERDIATLDAEIEKGRALESRRARMTDLEGMIAEAPAKRAGDSTPVREPLTRKSEEYRAAMSAYFRRGLGGLNAAEVRALQIGTDSEGGFLTAEEFDSNLRQTMDDYNVIRELSTVIQTSGDRKIPVESSLGTATYAAEEAAFTESDPAFGQVILDAYKLNTVVKVSEELLNDDITGIETNLAQMIGRRFANREEVAFCVGTGSGQPTGLTTQATLGKKTATLNVIIADELIDCFHALKAPYRRQATWVFNDATIAYIRKLKDGDGQYLWQPGLQLGQADLLLGRPVRSSAGMPVIAGDAVVGLFGDFSYNVVADRGPTVVQRLNELFSINGQVGFRAFMRHDAKLTLGEAIKTLVIQ
jgi:HK97 family phage major capsid protein